MSHMQEVKKAEEKAEESKRPEDRKSEVQMTVAGRLNERGSIIDRFLRGPRGCQLTLINKETQPLFIICSDLY